MLQSAAEASAASDGEPDTSGERGERRMWLIRHGVPHFTGDYSAGLRSRLLIVPLFAVLAYQLGAATWFGQLSASQLFLAPLVPVALALAVARLFLAPFGLAPSTPSRWWLLPLALLVPALAVLLVTSATTYGQTDPSTWWSPHPWIDFAVIFMALVTAAVLLAPHEWGRTARGTDKRWWILAAVLSAVVFFALESALFRPVSEILSEYLWNVLPGLPTIPVALPALIVMALALAASLRVVHGDVSVDAMAAPPATGTRSNVAFRALPFMVLGLGLDTALLRDYTRDWASILSPFLASLALALLFSCYERLPVRPTSLKFWLPLFVLAYPAWTLVIDPPEILLGGSLRTGLDAVVVIVAINSIYVLIAYVVVEWGLDGITVSAIRGARKNIRLWSAGAIHGLPLLLGITALSLHTAEFWEISAEMTRLRYIGFLSLLVIPVVVVILALSIHDLRAQSSAATSACTSPEPPLRLNAYEWINGLLIVFAFNSLVFVGLAVVSFSFFCTLANLTVHPDVAAEWVYGDGQERRAPELEQRGMVDSPWARVPLTLTAFSVLYVFVSVMASPHERDDFFGWVRTELRKCFDVRLAYRIGAQATPGLSKTSAG
jgi:hypothetical protein